MLLAEDILIRQACLDDWPAIKRLRERFAKTKAVDYISASLPELEAYLVNSLQNPTVGMIVAYHRERMVGLASVCVFAQPQLGVPGLADKRFGFINAIYIESSIRIGGENVMMPSEVGLGFSRAIEEWAKQRGATWLMGNVREGGPLQAFQRKYGFRVLHTIIGKEIADG